MAFRYANDCGVAWQSTTIIEQFHINANSPNAGAHKNLQLDTYHAHVQTRERERGRER